MQKAKLRLTRACLLALLVHTPPLLLAGELSPGLENAVQRAHAGERLAVLIRLREHGLPLRWEGETLQAFKRRQVEQLQRRAERTQAALKRWLKARGASQFEQLWAINALAAEVPATLMRELAERPEVAGVQLNRVRMMSLPTPAIGGPVMQAELPWNLAKIGADGAWNQGYTGQNVVVAIMDSGVDPKHNALKEKWRAYNNKKLRRASWFDAFKKSSKTPKDTDGHGTQVAGLVLGGSPATPMGVAPGAQWIAARIFNDGGTTTDAAILASFQWLLNPDGKTDTIDDQPDIVNASWGYPFDPADACGANDAYISESIAALWSAGIVTVFSAGNDGPDPSASYPANDPLAFSVGSVDELDAVGQFSSRGPSSCGTGLFPRIAAPGEGVVTADMTSNTFPDSTTTVQGTSFAAPHVSGALAVLKSAVSSASPGYLQAALEYSATDVDVPGADYASGYGLIHVGNALAWLQANNGRPVAQDRDSDGYTLDLDCNDYDSAVHPGSIETPRDGQDQDCNGYDLTIQPLKAVYSSKNKRLTVEVKSAWRANAALQVEGFPGMRWVKSAGRWRLLVKNLQEPPDAVTVTGMEGVLTIPVTMR